MNILHEKAGTFPSTRWRLGSLTNVYLSIAMCLTDVLVIMGASFATGLLYHLIAYDSVGNLEHYLGVGFLAVVSFVVPAAYQREYTFDRRQEMAAVLLWVIQTWTVGFFIIFVLGFLTKSTAVYSRGWLLLFYFSGLVTLTLGKYAVSRVINYAISRGYIAIQRVILVGLPEYVEKFLKGLRQKKYQIDILNVAYLSPDRNIEDSLRDIMNSARILAPDSVYLAIPLEKNQLIEKCRA